MAAPGLEQLRPGRFWLTNPADYVDVVDRWLRGSPIAQIDTLACDHPFGLW